MILMPVWVTWRGSRTIGPPFPNNRKQRQKFNWRKGSAVQSTCYSYLGSSGDTQLTVTPVPEDPVPAAGLLSHQVCTQHAHRQSSHKITIINL